MNKTLKVVVGIIIVLVVADLGATYFMGIRAKKQFYQLMAFLNSGRVASYEITQYDQGLMKSEAITKIRLRDVNNANKFITIKHTIYHGPFIIGKNKEKPLQVQLAVMQSQPTDMSPFYQVPFISDTIFKWNGDLEQTGFAEMIDIRDSGLQIIGKGLKSQMVVSENWSILKGNISLPDLIVQFMMVPVSIRDVEINFDQKLSKQGIWLGDVSFGFRDAQQKEQNVEISDFKLDENTVEKNALLDVIWSLDFSKIIAAADEYGPLHFQVEVSNLDPEGLKSLANINPPSSTATPHGMGPERSLKDGNASSSKEEIAYQKILEKRPKMSILPSTLKLPQGDIKIDAELSIGGPGISLPIDKSKVWETADGYFHAIIPKEILRTGIIMMMAKDLQADPNYQKLAEDKKKEYMDAQINLKIQKLMKDGLLTEQGSNYETKISIAKGKWVVNGKVLDKPLN